MAENNIFVVFLIILVLYEENKAQLFERSNGAHKLDVRLRPREKNHDRTYKRK